MNCGKYPNIWINFNRIIYEVFPLEKTWDGLPILNSDLIDYLVSQYDPDQRETSLDIVQSTFQTPSHNPFSVFRIQDLREEICVATPFDQIDYDPLTALCANREERMLFHHYVNQVAFAMMPFEHPRNPWKSSYPATALHHMSMNQKSLFNALLAHSAFNMAYLGSESDRMVTVATNHYNIAIRELINSFQTGEHLYGDTLAVISTLMMAEVIIIHSYLIHCFSDPLKLDL